MNEQNPLRKLLRMIDELGVRKGSSFNQRLSSLGYYPEWYAEAIGALRETMELCRNMSADGEDMFNDNKEVFKDLFDALVQPDVAWSGIMQGKELAASSRTAASNLAHVLDHAGSLPVSLSDTQLEGLRVAFEKIGDIVNGETGVSEDLRGYISYLVRRGLSILDGDIVDVQALRSLTFEVVGATATFGSTEGVSNESRKSLLETIRSMASAFFSDVLVETGAMLAAGGVVEGIRAIGS